MLDACEHCSVPRYLSLSCHALLKPCSDELGECLGLALAVSCPPWLCVHSRLLRALSPHLLILILILSPSLSLSLSLSQRGAWLRRRE